MTNYTEEEEAFMAKRTITFVPRSTAPVEPVEPRQHKQTAVRATSKLAYKQEQPKLSTKQQELYVMLSLAKRPMNDAELGKYLNWPAAIVSARRNELMDMGKIKEHKKAVYEPTGKLVTYWEIVK